MILQKTYLLTPHTVMRDVRKIPPLPLAIQKLYILVGNLDSEIRDITRTIASDEMLSAKILQIANSAFYGFTHRISSIQQAVAVIGFQSIRSLALSISVIQWSNNLQTAGYRETIWKHAIMVASAARLMAKKLRLKNPEEAFAAGILHDIGKLFFLQSYPQPYQSLLNQALQSEVELMKLERGVFQLNHVQVGGMICKQWNLPVPLIAAVESQGEPLEKDCYPFCENDSLIFVLKRAKGLVRCMKMTDKAAQFKALEEIAKPWTTVAALQDMMEALPAELKEIEVFLKH